MSSGADVSSGADALLRLRRHPENLAPSTRNRLDLLRRQVCYDLLRPEHTGAQARPATLTTTALRLLDNLFIRVASVREPAIEAPATNSEALLGTRAWFTRVRKASCRGPRPGAASGSASASSAEAFWQRCIWRSIDPQPAIRQELHRRAARRNTCVAHVCLDHALTEVSLAAGGWRALGQV